MTCSGQVEDREREKMRGKVDRKRQTTGEEKRDRKKDREGWSVTAHVCGVENNKKAAAAKHVYKLV